MDQFKAAAHQLNCAVNHANLPDELQHKLSNFAEQLRQMINQNQQASTTVAFHFNKPSQ